MHKSTASSTGRGMSHAQSSGTLGVTNSSGYFECPYCSRLCKSQTWFLKHIESCSGGQRVSGRSAGCSLTYPPVANDCIEVEQRGRATEHQLRSSQLSSCAEPPPLLSSLQKLDANEQETETVSATAALNFPDSSATFSSAMESQSKKEASQFSRSAVAVAFRKSQQWRHSRDSSSLTSTASVLPPRSCVWDSGVAYSERQTPQQHTCEATTAVLTRQSSTPRQGSFRLLDDGAWGQFTPVSTPPSKERADTIRSNEKRQPTPQSKLLPFTARRPLTTSLIPTAMGDDFTPKLQGPLPTEECRSGCCSLSRGGSGPRTSLDVSQRPSETGSITANINCSTERLGQPLVPVSGTDTPAGECSSAAIELNATDVVSRSVRGSTSLYSNSRVPSSPMFAQGIATPATLHGGSPPSTAGSVGRVSAPGMSGGLTPRALSFQRGRAVGSGGFGTVYQAILFDGSLVAVKQLTLETTDFKAIDREVRAMSGIPPHPNCVKYLGSRHSTRHYYIIMEYISGGSINSLRKSVGKFRESVFQRYAYMVLLGLSHLHQHGILHRDIKGANVLLDERGCAKIVDFGCSRGMEEVTMSISGGGTPLWMAPEICRGDVATEKSDVWSFGCLCLEMTNDTGLPWSFPSGMTVHGVVYALACAKTPPAIPTDLSDLAQDFLSRCLKVDTDERATVEELLKHPFFDLNLLDVSDEDLSSSQEPSNRESAVKRAVRQVNRSSLNGAVFQRLINVSDDSDEDERSAHSGCRTAQDLDGAVVLSGDSPVVAKNEWNHSPVVGSQLAVSKSPSGPQLDHYMSNLRVNSMQNVDALSEDDDEEMGNQLGALRHPCIHLRQASCTSQPYRQFAPNACPGAVEGNDECTQDITELITEAREAYTEEERLLAERRRLHAMMDSDGSSSDMDFDHDCTTPSESAEPTYEDNDQEVHRSPSTNHSASPVIPVSKDWKDRTDTRSSSASSSSLSCLSRAVHYRSPHPSARPHGLNVGTRDSPVTALQPPVAQVAATGPTFERDLRHRSPQYAARPTGGEQHHDPHHSHQELSRHPVVSFSTTADSVGSGRGPASVAALEKPFKTADGRGGWQVTSPVPVPLSVAPLNGAGFSLQRAGTVDEIHLRRRSSPLSFRATRSDTQSPVHRAEWVTEASARQEASVVWRTSGAASVPKGLSIAQREVQELLEWPHVERMGTVHHGASASADSMHSHILGLSSTEVSPPTEGNRRRNGRLRLFRSRRHK